MKLFQRLLRFFGFYTCQHKWRVFGTRIDEEVWIPSNKKHHGFIVCMNCGEEKYVKEYKVIKKEPYKDLIPTSDYIVEIVEE